MDEKREVAEETRNGGAKAPFKFFHSSHQIDGSNPSDITAPTDKAVADFVNSSIATSSGRFQGTYETVGDLPLSGVRDNDYAFVVTVKPDGNPEYDRYKFSAQAGWMFEYRLNNSGFTAAQWAAITSGLTAADKARLDAMEDGAQANRIESVNVNGTAVEPVNKSVDIAVPTKTSDIENDLDFATNAGTVHKTGDEMVGGVKTFSDSPIVPNTTVGTDDDSAKAASTGWVGRKIAAWWENLRKTSAIEFSKSVKAVGGFIGNLTGDVTGHASADVPQTRKVAGHALTMDVELSASDVGALPDTTVIPSGNQLVSSEDRINWNGKADKATGLTGATKCKITYNAQGIVTAGADLSATDLPSHTHTKSQITDFPTIPPAPQSAKTWTVDGSSVTVNASAVKTIKSNVQSNWTATSGDAVILNKPNLAKVATSGSYNDLSNKPTRPTIPSLTKTDSGSGSVVTGLSVSGHAITVTKGNIAAATTSAPGLMSAADKTKLDGIATGANAYTHPSHTAHTSGLYKVTVDNQGHVSAATAVVKADITALGIPGSQPTAPLGRQNWTIDGQSVTVNASKAMSFRPSSFKGFVRDIGFKEYRDLATNTDHSIVADVSDFPVSCAEEYELWYPILRVYNQSTSPNKVTIQNFVSTDDTVKCTLDAHESKFFCFPDYSSVSRLGFSACTVRAASAKINIDAFFILV